MLEMGLACVGTVCAGGAGFCAWHVCEGARLRARYKDRVRLQDESDQPARCREGLAAGSSVDELVIAYAKAQSQALSLGHGRRVMPDRLASAHWIDEHAACAGLGGQLSVEGFWEARVRLAATGGCLGACAGALLSGELALLLFAAGVVAGWRVLPQAIVRQTMRRAGEMERHLPEMLDVVSLGMRSGLSFDRSLALYAEHFDTMLAHAFASAQRQWSCGLARRDEAIRGIAATYDSALLVRVAENIVRSLRFGSSMAEGLEASAREARASYRARKQEQVAKAPVKIVVPTGTLILPAMLIMVLGPVLLELVNGF